LPAASPKHAEKPAESGLRDRKKAMRREVILSSAKARFAVNGIKATTMAEIAEDVGVSTPTIFNYFGNKDGILIALIGEGTSTARDVYRGMAPREDADFATILVDMFTHISEHTLQIASKRIWRYAEAAAIRHPGTDLAREYAVVDRELVKTLVEFFGHYDIRLCSGLAVEPGQIAAVFFDVWSALFLDLIKDDTIDIAEHKTRIRNRLGPLAAMLFDPQFLTNPVLKPKSVTHAQG
jgi:AcrR family transcriptional regulator